MNMQLNEFDTVMEQIGFGKVHCYIMLTLGLLQMLTIHETMGMGIIAPSALFWASYVLLTSGAILRIKWVVDGFYYTLYQLVYLLLVPAL
ncbi:PREDICTED: uncharacterized protein LOC108620617 isoform X3 [Drosophila arizonae]|uniref:Uncharacterized protein LOC108620617 isoform X3 n=1 Tax=Drosophila arizonae TaxID=7263 RepID=A0ABM1Q0M1_DROAR|nr:PREDICTED: uncharacterized protein LOC108620617 isoform X3 [Drosophila arizonae]